MFGVLKSAFDIVVNALPKAAKCGPVAEEGEACSDEGPVRVIKIEPVATTRVDFVDGKAKQVGTIMAVPGGGIGGWFTSPEGHTLDMVAVRGQCYFGLRAKGNSGPNNLAFSIDASGKPVMQVSDGTYDGTKIVDLSKLIDKLVEMAK